METMHALRAHQRGGPEVLKYDSAPMPTLGATDVLVRVSTAGITFTELLWTETWERDGVSRLPTIPAHEVAGIVVATGDDVDAVSPGDEVLGLVPFDRDGAAAEFVALPQDWVAPRPPEVDPVHAAALPLAALTALQALVDHGRIAHGSRVLIQGAAGAVGIFAVQLAHLRGARVTAVARARDFDLLRLLGADEVLDFTVDRISAPEGGFDIALYCAAGVPDEDTYAAVRDGGVLIGLNGPLDRALLDRFRIEGSFFVVSADRAELDELAALVRDGELSVPIAATFALRDGKAAYESGSAAGRLPGKTVLIVHDDTA